jgi:FkbM family methyltransferase
VPSGKSVRGGLDRLARLTAVRRAELRQALELGDLSEYAAAWRFARRYGVSPLVYPHAREASLNMLPPWVDPRAGLLVDLGANEGAWTAHALRVFPGLDVVAAEPGTQPLVALEARFSGHGNVTIDPRAVTDSTGTSTYHRTRSSVFASLLPPAASLPDLYPVEGSPTEVIETVEVDTVTLDELIGGRRVSVLKIDVQGGELAVLRGGHRVLENTAAVLVEVLYLPHYEGDTTFPGLHKEMTRIGFTLIDLSPPARLGDGPALWADACYARLPERVSAAANIRSDG